MAKVSFVRKINNPDRSQTFCNAISQMNLKNVYLKVQFAVNSLKPKLLHRKISKTDSQDFYSKEIHLTFRRKRAIEWGTRYFNILSCFSSHCEDSWFTWNLPRCWKYHQFDLHHQAYSFASCRCTMATRQEGKSTHSLIILTPFYLSKR